MSFRDRPIPIDKAPKTLTQYQTTKQPFTVGTTPVSSQLRLSHTNLSRQTELYHQRKLSNLLDVKSPIFMSDTFKPGSGWRSEPMVSGCQSPSEHTAIKVRDEAGRRSIQAEETHLKDPVFYSVSQKLTEVKLQLPFGMSSRLAEHMLNGYVKDRLLERWATKRRKNSRFIRDFK